MNPPDKSEAESPPEANNQLAVHRALETWARSLVESLQSVTINADLIGEVISSGVRNAERIVVRYHTNLWNAARGHALIELSRHTKEQKRRVQDKLREYNRAKRQYHRRSSASRFVNWTAWGLFKMTLALVSMFGFLIASVISAFEIFRNTSQFGDSWSICFAVATLVGCACVSIKLLAESLQTEAAARRLNYILAGITFLLGVTYISLFAFSTGGFLVEPTDILHPTTSRVLGLGIYLQWSQMLLEMFGANASYAYAHLIYIQHRSPSAAPNPDAWLFEDRLNRADRELSVEQHALHELPTLRNRLIAERRAFVDAARSNYLIRAEAARKQRSGIEAKASGKVDASTASRPSTPWIDRFIDFFRN
jgi:ABC-type multidrug transport system fused ATPase/permease subunit